MAEAGVQAYFQSRRTGLDGEMVERLVAFIGDTRESLDCAIYDLRHPRVLEALTVVAARGKRLRIVYDGAAERTGGLGGDPRPSGTQQAIEGTGLAQYATAVHERSRHLMHNKFLVRDGEAVWTGSANFTVGGLEQQDNNCLAIASAELAAAYGAVFAEVLSPDHRHEATKGAAGRAVRAGGATITPYFEPQSGEGIENAIIQALRGARKIRVLAFLIGDPGILVALAPYAQDRAFDIQGIYDPHGMQDVLRYSRQSRERTWFLHDPRFVAAPSHPFHPKGEQDFMHNKVFIIDDRVVITGSYNFSENAEANDENLLAIESEALAAEYTSYFDRLAATYRHAPVSKPAAEPATVAQAAQQREALVAEADGGPRGHIFIMHQEGRVRSGPFYLGATKQAVPSETVAGQTQHFVVYTDGTPDGNAAAQAVLQSAEADYTAVRDWFGDIDLPQGQEGDDQTVPRTALPLHVLIDPQAGGAYHFGCNATDLYIDPHADEAPGLMVAELVEVFEAAINNGWQCGQTNGEALSRALAVARHAVLSPLIVQTAQGWWANGHADYVNNNSADDTNQDANGCGTLFLYYLNSQLGYSWRQITTTGGATLGECYAKLTGRPGSEGFADFLDRLATLDTGSGLTLPASGNPFPVAGSAQPGPSAPAGSGEGQGIPIQIPVSVPDLPPEVRGNPALMILVLVVLGLVALIGALSASGVLHLP